MKYKMYLHMTKKKDLCFPLEVCIYMYMYM